jgi:hypothetical protein
LREGENWTDLLPCQRQQPIPREPHGQQQQCAEQHKPPLPIAAQRLDQELQSQRTNHRGDDALCAPDDRHGNHQAHLIDRTDIGREDADIVPIETAGQPREARRDRKRQDAQPHHLHAGRRRSVLVLADSAEEQPPARCHQQLHDRQRSAEQRQSQVVIRHVRRAMKQRRDLQTT